MIYTTTGIDFGTSTIRIAVLEHDTKVGASKILSLTKTDSLGMRHGYVTNQTLAVKCLKKALADAEKASGIRIKQALASIGSITVSSIVNTGSTIISKADGEITDLDIEKAVKESEESLPLDNRRIVYRSTIEFKIDGKTILGRPEGMKGAKLEVKTVFVICLTQHYEDLEGVFYDAGIELIDMIPSGIPSAHVGLTEKQKMVGGALVSIGSETVSLSVFEDMKLLGLHTFQIGSTDITNDIALGLKISLEEAEGVKLGTSAILYPRKKLDDIVEARFSDIFELMETYLKKIKRNELLPAGITFIGGGSLYPGLEDMAKGALKLPAKIGKIELETNSKGVTRDVVWHTAYGLALLADDYENAGGSGSGGASMKKFKHNVSTFFRQFMP